MFDRLKENIIKPAWELTNKDGKLKKFYFFPGVLSIIFLTGILVYQSIYTYVEIFGKKEEALVIILKFLESDYMIEAIIMIAIFLIIYILAIPTYEGGLIKFIDNEAKGEKMEYSDVVSHGLYKFLPIFEYNNIFAEFKFISILNLYLFAMRFIGLENIRLVNYVFLFLLFISFIVNIIFAYAKYEIVLNNKKAMSSLSASSSIALINLPTTFKLYFFMFLLNIRVIINFSVLLSFPLLITSIISYLTSQIFTYIAVGIVSVIFLLFILFLGYMAGVLEVFKTSIRYYAYVDGKKKIDAMKGGDDD